jgi:protein-S-isoprenylcysteine O-methyltransferase Ste14
MWLGWVGWFAAARNVKPAARREPLVASSCRAFDGCSGYDLAIQRVYPAAWRAVPVRYLAFLVRRHAYTDWFARKLRIEEQRMREQFDGAYDQYAARVPALVPFIR